MSEKSKDSIRRCYKELFDAWRSTRIAGAGLRNAGDKQGAQEVEKIANDLDVMKEKIYKKLGHSDG